MENFQRWPELSSNALHGLAGDFVKTIEPETESDNVALLTQFLITFGNVVGRCPHFIAEADKHFTIGNVCLVGETAKGKKVHHSAMSKEYFKELMKTGRKTVFILAFLVVKD
ncbi:MAG TPA: hypothetical protein EYN83_08075 [Nitrospinaceae bacterium]|nr:hypothetical protein [Nitrospinaceae bacterium]